MFKPGRNALYLIPAANHYVQKDRPDAFVQALEHALSSPDDAAPGALDGALTRRFSSTGRGRSWLTQVS
jgi:hypothetical protein